MKQPEQSHLFSFGKLKIRASNATQNLFDLSAHTIFNSTMFTNLKLFIKVNNNSTFQFIFQFE